MISKQCDIPIISAQSCLDLNLLARTYENESKSDLIEAYQDVFKGIEKLEIEYHIKLKTGAVRVKSALRKFPLALKEKVKEELDHSE